VALADVSLTDRSRNQLSSGTLFKELHHIDEGVNRDRAIPAMTSMGSR
jgi:hypothetical protein